MSKKIRGMQNEKANREFAKNIGGKNIPGTSSYNKVKKAKTEMKKMLKGMDGNVRSHIKMQNCLSPQCCAVVKLMDDPFNAAWEDAKLPFYPGGQPLKTTVVRAYGSHSLQTIAGSASQIYWIPNPWRPTDGASSEPALQPILQGATIPKGIAGCPPFSVANAIGTSATAGPHSGFVRTYVNLGTAVVFNPTATDGDSVMAWSSTSALGNDAPDLPGTFAYRIIAAAMKITPTSKEVDLGGWMASSRIGESTNLGYAGTSIMFGNSSVHFARSDNTYEIRYARSGDDDGWNYPATSNAPAGSNILGARNFITLHNADALVAPSFMITYVAYYEVKGVAAKKVGTESFQQPNDAAKVQTAMSHIANQQTGHTLGSEKNEFQDMVELVNAKQSPAVGTLAKGTKTKKGFTDNLKDFVSNVAPVAEKLIEGVLPLLL